MSGIRAKNAAIKKYMQLSKQVNYKPKDVNLRIMNASQIETAYKKLEKYATDNKNKNGAKVRNVVKNRSALIKQIKELNPNFRSKRNDTYDNLLVKYRQNLPKKTYLSSINNSKLIKFLKNPSDEASITTTAESLVQSIQYMPITNNYYLLMNAKLDNYDIGGERAYVEDEYRVISNIENIKELVSKINAPKLQGETIKHGSDTEVIYSLLTTYRSNITLTWYTIESYKRVHSGAYFKYYNNTKFDLMRYQIFKQDYDSSEEDKINCLVYAFEKSNKLDNNVLDNLKLSLFHKEIKARDIKKIAIQLGITIKLRYDPKQSASVFNKGCAIEIPIGLVDNHYFLDEQTKITKMTLDKYDEFKDDINFPNIQPKKCKQQPLSSYQVINTMFSTYSDRMLIPITLNNISNKQTIEKINEYEELRAPKKVCDCEELICHCKKSKFNEFKDYSFLSNKSIFKGFFKNPDTNPNLNFDIWFIDTETFIKEKLNYHIANTLCAIKYNEKLDTFQEYTFFGLDCVEKFLRSLTKNSVIYAHNMAFDFRVFIDHLYELQTPIETGTKLKQIQG